MSPKEKYSLKKTCFSLPLYCLDNLRSTNTKYLNASIIKTWPLLSVKLFDFQWCYFYQKRKMNTCLVLEHNVILCIYYACILI